LIGVEFPGRVEFLRQRERPFEARLRLVAQLRELDQDYNQLVLPYLNYALACAPIPRQVPYAPERPYLEAKTPSAPPPGVLLWQSRGEQRSRQSKKPRRFKPGLIDGAQTICKPTRGEMVNALHWPDGLADSLPRARKNGQRRP
jgi:hypothetical protein